MRIKKFHPQIEDTSINKFMGVNRWPLDEEVHPNFQAIDIYHPIVVSWARSVDTRFSKMSLSALCVVYPKLPQ